MRLSRSRRAMLLTVALVLSIFTGVLSGCESKDPTTNRTTNQMKGGGPPIPESHRPGGAPQPR